MTSRWNEELLLGWLLPHFPSWNSVLVNLKRFSPFRNAEVNAEVNQHHISKNNCWWTNITTSRGNAHWLNEPNGNYPRGWGKVAISPGLQLTWSQKFQTWTLEHHIILHTTQIHRTANLSVLYIVCACFLLSNPWWAWLKLLCGNGNTSALKIISIKTWTASV